MTSSVLLGKLAVVLALSYASIQDLQSYTVHDKVFLAGLFGALAGGIYSQSLIFVGSMLVQGLLGVVFMFILQVFYSFGTADIWAVGISVMVFPEILLFSLFIPLFICTLVWTKVYGLVLRRDSAPALPGILTGFLVLLSIHGI